MASLSISVLWLFIRATSVISYLVSAAMSVDLAKDFLEDGLFSLADLRLETGLLETVDSGLLLDGAGKCEKKCLARVPISNMNIWMRP